MEAATVEAALRTEQVSAEPQQIAIRELGGLTLEAAFRSLDWQTVYDAWDSARWHRETLDTIADEDNTDNKTVGDVRDYISDRLSDLRKYSFIDRHPFEALLVAARSSVDPVVCAVVEAIKDKLPSGDDVKVEEDTLESLVA